MSVSDRDVLHVAALANLELTEDERTHLLRDLNSILGYVNRLNELDTTGVPAMAAVSGPAPELRADQPQPSLAHEDALRNAPDSDGVYFEVPKVIER